MAQNILALPRTQALRTAETPHLQYFGGKLLKSPQFIGVYPGSYWSTEAGASDRAYIDKAAPVISQGRYTNLWREYGAGRGKYRGSVQIDSQSNQSNYTDKSIQQMLKRGLQTRAIQSAGAESVYTVFLPKGSVLQLEDITSRDGLGGYHSSYLNKDKKPVYYSVIVYSEGENGIPFSEASRDNITIATSHEWSEVVTDPDISNGRLGWYDNQYGEVADIPLSMGMPLEKVWGRIDGVALQKNWSNRDHRVELVPK